MLVKIESAEGFTVTDSFVQQPFFNGDDSLTEVGQELG